LRGILPKSSVVLCVTSWQKDSMQMILIIKIFPVYDGKCLSRKELRYWVKSKVTDNKTEARKWVGH
jgi:hypothetical protein